ncbi:MULTISPECIES: ABC transporter substrate-binding protein [Demequina]|uniref:ABC transporter substrate-binding protein n=1 Tax=Demequina TaxID=577469 RepID=UPI000786452F|nr:MULTISPECIES: ABC transporter substrate-binding protein [Demequina]
MFRRTSVIAATTAGVLALAACSSAGGTADPSPSADPSVTTTSAAHAPLLRLGMVDAPGENGFVAANMRFATQSPYGQAVYDTLVRSDEEGAPVEGLATTWAWDVTGTILELELREGVTFTDGTAFNADAAVQNLLRFRDGSAENASWLAGVTEVVALDARRVQITLAEPDQALLTHLSKSAGYMESPASFDDPAPVGTGPYILDEARSIDDASYVFTANPEYWDPASQHYDEIIMSVYEEPDAMQSALLRSELDAALYTGYSGFDQIEAAGYASHEFTLDWTGLLLFDRNGAIAPELASTQVRQAINYAIDRDQMLETLLGGRGETTAQVFGPDTAGYAEELDTTYIYSPTKARSLLADAGYPDGFTLTIPTVSFVPGATFDLLAEQLGDVGITVEFVEESTQSYVGSLLSGQYAVASMQIEQPASAWETYALEIAADSPWNVTHRSDEWIDELGEKIATGDIAAAAALNKYVVNEAWFAPWYRNLQVFYTAPGTDVTLQVGNAYPYLWNIGPSAS